MLELKYDLGKLKRELDELAKKQFPFALSQALNKTAVDIRNGWKEEMQSVFNKPVALTMNAVLYEKATKQNLTARVFIRDQANGGTPPTRYLVPEVRGGDRNMKRSERALQLNGIMPDGMYWVPGAGATLTSEGNFSGALMRRILNQLKASTESAPDTTDAPKARKRRVKRVSGKYFALSQPRGRMHAGVYQRVGQDLKAIMIFVNRTSYAPRAEIEVVGQRIFDEKFPANYQAAMEKALATAKR